MIISYTYYFFWNRLLRIVNKFNIYILFYFGFNTPTLASSFPRWLVSIVEPKRESRTLDSRVRGSDKIPSCLRRGCLFGSFYTFFNIYLKRSNFRQFGIFITYRHKFLSNYSPSQSLFTFETSSFLSQLCLLSFAYIFLLFTFHISFAARLGLVLLSFGTRSPPIINYALIIINC